jgi:hypothetical protein
MPLLEDVLLRFRRIWTPPGPAAGQTAVPADLEARMDDELRELTSALAAIEEEGESIERAAGAEASDIIAAAQLDAERTVAEARERLPEVRATTAAERIRNREADIAQLTAGAEKRASELRERARARMQGFVDRAVEMAFAESSASLEGDHARVMGGG